ncbi:MAG: ribonuclease HIII [Candidatus Fermentibacteraceae bacterium]|nr:ribonuclease HIII [Candidatus Fermentibacteraceae bacterium]
MTSLSELMKLADNAIRILQRDGIQLESRRDLVNGIQIRLADGDESCGFNLYYSKKKGFTAVPSGGDKLLIERIENLLLNDETQLPDETWIGSDEAGKGDYMGPLTAAAVYVDASFVVELKNIGVTDSKNLSDKVIRKYAGEIRNIAPDFSTVISINPIEYNRRFVRLKISGKNSLDLLAECHAEAITRLLKNVQKPDRIIIDKFCPEKRIRYLLPTGDYKLDLRVRGESDTAVAAASILARDAYLDGLDTITARFGIKAKPGSGREIDTVCREFVKKYGSDILDRIAKVHFKNTDKIFSLFAD